MDNIISKLEDTMEIVSVPAESVEELLKDYDWSNKMTDGIGEEVSK